MVGGAGDGATQGSDGGRTQPGRRRAVLVLAGLVVVAAAAAVVLRPGSDGSQVTAAAPAPRRVLVDPPGGPWSVAATDPGTGRMAWGLPVEDGFEIVSGLALDGGVLYGQHGTCARDAGERTTGVVAIRAEDGAVLWRSPPLFGGETALDENLRSAHGGVYVALNDGEDIVERPTELVGVDVGSGRERWRRVLSPRGGRSSVALLDGPVLVVATPQPDGGASLRALDRATGDVHWEQDLAEQSVQALGVVGDRLVLSSWALEGGGSPVVRGLDLATGATVWTAPEVHFQHPGHGLDGVVLVTTTATPRDSAVGLDLATGAERWRRSGWEDRRGLYRDVVERNEGEQAIDEAVDVATGATRWRARAGLRIIVAREEGVLFDDAGDGAAPGEGGPGVVLLAPDGTEVGTVAQLPDEPDQVEVAPVVDRDHRTYLGRGCPGRP